MVNSHCKKISYRRNHLKRWAPVRGIKNKIFDFARRYLVLVFLTILTIVNQKNLMKHFHFLRLLSLFSLTTVLVISCKRENIIPQNQRMTDVNAQNSAANKFNNEFTATGDYIMISASENSLPSNLKTDVAALHGTIKGKLDGIGLAFVHSANPDFITKASAIKGVRSVIYDITTNWLPADEEK